MYISIRARVSAGVAVLLIALVGLSLVALPAKTATALTSDTVNFQAKLMTNTGAIAADGNYNVQFNLYSASSGGSALWTETYLNSNSQGLRVVNGYLNANLGSITAFPSNINWDQDLYIGMTVRGTGSTSFALATPNDGEMTPRLKLTAVPFAFSAGNLANVSGGFKSTLSFQGATVGDQSFVIPNLGAAASDTVCLLSLANCAGTGGGIAGFGVQNYISKFDTSGGNHIGVSSVYDDGNFVGINTTTNNGLLTIQGASTTQSGIFIQGHSSATAATAVIKQASSQTGNLLELQDSSGNVNASFNAAGNILQLGKAASSGTVSQGKLSFADGTTDNFTLTLQAATQTVGSSVVSIPNTGGTNDTVCLYTLANCVGTGGGITGSGTQNYLSKFNNVPGTTIGNSSIYDNGSFVGVNTTTNNGLVSIVGASATQSSLFVQGMASQSVAATILRQGSSATGDLFDLQDSSSNVQASFSSAGNTLTLGNNSASGTSAGSIRLTDGTSDGFFATLNLAGAISGNQTYSLPTTGGTICIANSSSCGFESTTGNDFIQNQTASTQSAGFKINGNGTAASFIATTSVLANLLDATSAGGSVSIGTTNATAGINLNQSTTIAAGKNISFASGAGNFDMHLSSGTFQTGTGNISLNGNTTLAAGKGFTITGGGTGTRPISPTAGTLYYDTTTNTLLVYNGTKWVSNQKHVIVVAASNSTQAQKDSADYVAAGTHDQNTINTALTAAAGGTVFLLPGTYDADGTILIPDHTALQGSNASTLVKLDVGSGSDNLIENANNGDGAITIRDILVDDSLATGGTQNAIYLHDLAGSNTTINNIVELNWTHGDGLYAHNSGIDFVTNNFLTAVVFDSSSWINTFQGNEIDSATVDGATVLSFNGNTSGDVSVNHSGSISTFNDNAIGNLSLANSATITTANNNKLSGDLTVTGATIHSFTANDLGNTTLTSNGYIYTYNGNSGFAVSLDHSAIEIIANNYTGTITLANNSNSENISSNESTQLDVTSSNVETITGNSLDHIAIDGDAWKATIAGNTLLGDSGDAISLTSTSNAIVTGNQIVSPTGYAINITNAASNNTYLANNNLNGHAIHDLGTGTIYGGQTDASGNYVIQPTGGISLNGATTVTGNLIQSGGAVNLQANAASVISTSTGDLSLDAAGTLKLGTGSTGAVTIGKSGITTTIQGNTAVTLSATTGGSLVCINGSNVLASCTNTYETSTGTDFIQNQNASTQTANFKISGIGTAATFSAGTSVLTPLVDTASAGALNIGLTSGGNATSINLNQNTTVANNASFTAGGSALFKDATNSTTAFRIQDASANNFVNVDTVNAGISLGQNTTKVGYQIYGQSANSGGQNGIAAFKITPSASGTIRGINYYIGVADSAPNNKYQVALYADGSGCGSLSSCPGSLIASTGDQTIVPNSWNQVSLTANVTAGTSYWLAVNTNATINGANNGRFDNGTGGNYIFTGSQTYGTWPSSFPTGGSFTSSSKSLSIYAYEATATSGAVLGIDGPGRIQANNEVGISTDSTKALNVTDGGGSSAFKVDTVDHMVGVNVAAPAAALDIQPSQAFNVGLQVTAAGAQNANLLQLVGDFGVGGTGITAAFDNTGANLTLGHVAGTNGLAGSISFADGTTDGFKGKIQLSGAIASNQTYSLPTVGGTFCMQGSSSCGFESTTGNDFIQNQTASTQSAGFKINGTGTLNTVQISTSGSIDTSAAGTINIGLTSGGNATSINLNQPTTAVAGISLTNGGSLATQKGTDFATSGSSNDVNFGTASLYRLTGSSAQTITGIAGGVDGRILTLVNAASQAATLSNNSGSSSAANRIITGTGADLTLPAGGSIALIYDNGASVWRVNGSVPTTSSGVTSVGALNGGTANATGATISGNTIYLQSASSSFAGLVDTGSQTFAGAKTFNGLLTANGGLTTSGTVTIGGLGAGLVQSSSGGVISSGAVDRNSSTFFSNALSVANGGTGATTFTSNGILYGNSTGAVQVTAAGTGGQLLLANASGVPVFTTLGGDIASVGNTGSVTVGGVRGQNFSFTSLTNGDVLQYNGTNVVNAHITNNNLTAGTYSNITGTGALSAGSIASGFGTISTTNNIGTSATVSAGTFDANSAGALTLGGSNATSISITQTANIAANKDIVFASGSGSFDQSASSGTFKTGTGAVSLNGATTATNGLTLTNGGSLATQKNADFSTTGTSNDVNLGSGSLVRLTGSSAQTITGISGGVDGRILTIVNAASQAATISNQNTGSTTAGDRIITGTGQDISLAPDASLTLVYDSGASRWRVQGGVGGTGVTSVGAISGNSTANGASITGNTLNLAVADATNGGVVSTAAQTFAGLKSFQGGITSSQINTTAGQATSLGNSTGSLTITGNSSSTFVINGSTIDATEFTLLDGKDAPLVDTNDAVATAITGTGALTTGSINWSGAITTSGNISTTGSGTITSAGLLTASGGLTATNINTTAAQATNLGNSTGAFTFTGNSSSTFVVNGVIVDATEFNRLDGKDAPLVDTNDAVATAITGTGALTTGSINWSGNIATSGNISTNGTGTITSAGIITANGGLNVAGTGALSTAAGTSFTTAGTSNNAALNVASFYTLNTSGAAQVINGITAGVDGQRLTLTNINANTATLTNNSGSATGGKIITGTGADATIPQGASVELIYDGTASVWRVVGATAASGGSGVNSIGTYSSSNHYANGATISGTTLTLGSADASNPGLIDTGAQTLAGLKTFQGGITSSNINTTAGQATTLGNSTGTLTINGNSSTTFVINGSTVDATEFTRLDGKDAALVDTNDAVATAITGTGTLTTGSINWSGAIATSGNISTTGSGTITSAGLLTASGGLTAANINTTATQATSLGNASGAFTFTGNSSSTFVVNGQTVDATEFNRLDGKDAALVDTNDAVATAITGTGTLTTGSINWSGNIATSGNISTSGTGTISSAGVITANGGVTVANTGSLATQKNADFSTTGTSNDVNLGAGSLVRLTGASAQTITGISGGVDGRILTIVNAASQAATLSNQNTGSTTAGDRIITGTGQDLSLAPDASVTLVYDSATNRWRVQGGVGGTGVNTVGAISGTSTANGASITGNTLNLAVADATNGGVVSTSAQSFAGLKTFQSGITSSQINTTAGQATSLGNSTGALTITGNSSSTFVINGSTIDATEFTLLDGKDAALVDVNDAVNTAITGTGALTTGSINWSGAIATSGNISTSGSGTITAAGLLTANGGLTATNINTTAAQATSLGNSTGAFTFTGNSSSTFVVNGQTVDATEFNRLDGKDAALVDTNDAVATAITGTGALTTGSINWSGNIATSGNISTSGTGTITSAGIITANGGVKVANTGSLQTAAGSSFTTAGTSTNAALNTASFYTLNTSGAAQVIQGITAGADGQRLTLTNINASAVTLANNNGSATGSKIITGTGADMSLVQGASVELIYDSTASVWRVVGGVGGTSVTSVGTISGTSNANGATITGNTLNLTAADGTNGGVLTNAAQTIAGLKTFQDGVTSANINTTAGQATTLGNSTGTLTINGNSSTTFVINGSTVDATEFTRLDGKDAALVDTNDAVATAITGTGTLTTGSINWSGAIATSGNISTSGSGTITSAGLLTASGGLTATNINTTAAQATNIGNATGTLTLTGNSSTTFVVNGQTVDATEFNRLDGKDAPLVDTNDAVATAVTGTGALTTGSINWSGNIATSGNISTSGTGTITSAGTITANGGVTITNTGSLATQKNADFSTTGTSNDVNLGSGSLVRLTGSSAQTITGISGGVDGRILTIVNAASQAATISNQNTGSTTAGDRIITGTGQDISLAPDASLTLVYDSGASRWRVQGGVGGTGVTSVGAISGTSTANGASITGNTLNLTVADASNGGVVSTSSQTFAGLKTFQGGITSGNINTTAGQATSLGNSTGALTVTGNSSSTWVINGSTIDATEFSRLDGKDAALVDTNDAVATAITGTGTLTTGSINWSGAIATSGNISTSGSGTITSAGLLTASGGLTAANINTTAAQATSLGNSTGAFTFTGNSSSTFVVNGQTVDATEFNRLDGKDAALVDTNDAVATAITGTGALTTGSINWSGNIATSGNISTSGTGTITSAGIITANGGITVANTGSLSTAAGASFTTAGTSTNAALNTAGYYTLNTSGAAQVIQGITAGRDGQQLTLTNINALAVTLSNNNAGATGSKIITGTGGDISLATGASITLIYDNTASVWRVTGQAAGTGVTNVGSYSSSNHYANGASISGTTLTLGSADASNPGLVDTGSQTFAGAKTFSSLITGNAGITTSGGAVSLQGNAASSLTTTAGGLTIDTTTAAGQTIAIGNSNITHTIQIGTASGSAQTITIGSSNAGSTLTLAAGGGITLSNDTTSSGNFSIASGKYLSIAGSGTRPSSPTEGMVYYDTTQKRLLTYSNGKWQTDARTAILVAASNSSQADKDAADYVTTGTADQTIINSALTAGSGKQVVLLAGTYSITGGITVPNNTTLAGVGRGTYIQLSTSVGGTDIGGMIQNSDTSNGTGVVVRDLRLDGNSATNGGANHRGVDFSGMGAGTGNSLRPGGKILNVEVYNIWWYGIAVSGNNNLISGNTVYGQNSGRGPNTAFSIGGSYNTVTDNTAQGGNGGFSFNSYDTITGNVSEANASYGFQMGSNNTLSGNISKDNGGDGFYVNSGSFNTITGNTANGNTGAGVNVEFGSKNTVSGNSLTDNGGASHNNGIRLFTASNNSFTGNNISDTTATTDNYAITSNAGGTSNYFSNNILNGGGINNLSSTDIYGDQMDASGNMILRTNGGGLGLNTTTVSATLSLQGGLLTSQLPTPSISGVTVTGSTGSTVYRYQVTALDGTGESLPSAVSQITNGIATGSLNGSNYNTVTWAAIPGAVQYNIYRCSVAACTPTKLTTVNGGAITSFNDTSAGSPAGALPTTNTTGGATIAGLITGQQGITVSGGAISLTGNANSTISTSAGNLTADAAAALQLGNTNATSIAIGHSGIITTITGALTQQTGAFSLTGNAASSLTTTAGGLAIDTTTAAGQTIAIGNSNITHTVQIATNSGSAQTVSIGSSNASSTLGLTAGGGITINSNTTLANGVSITYGTSGNFDQSASSGTFKTGSGAVSLNGATTVGANLTVTNAGSLATNAGASFTTAGTSANAALNVAGFYTLNTSGAAQVIQGITAGRDGQQLTLTNINATAVTLANNNGSATGSKIITGTGADVSLVQGASAQLIYDNTASVWRIVGGIGGTSVTTIGTYSASNHYANGASISGNTLTLGSADSSNPGLVDTGAQTFAGAKTFSALITGNAGITTSGGAVSLQGNAASSLTTTSGNLTADAAAALQLGNTNATSIAIGHSGITTTITGGLTQNTGAFSLQGNAASSLTTTAGGLTIDTTTAAGQTIAIANSNITHTVQIATDGGSAQTITIGSSNASSTLTLAAGGG